VIQSIAKIVDYKITGAYNPYVIVNLSIKRLPITVYLLDEYGGILDFKIVHNKRELPVRLNLAKYKTNLIDEKDYIRVVYNGKVIDEKEIQIKGPKIKLLDYNLYFERWVQNSCIIRELHMTLKNEGDVPAYIESARLYIKDSVFSALISNKPNDIAQNETKRFSTYRFLAVGMGYKGLSKLKTYHNVTLELVGPDKKILVRALINFTVKC